MYEIGVEKRIALDRAFAEGKSLRDAAKIAGCSKQAAQRFRMINGGTAAYRQRGARFRRNRWESTRA